MVCMKTFIGINRKKLLKMTFLKKNLSQMNLISFESSPTKLVTNVKRLNYKLASLEKKILAEYFRNTFASDKKKLQEKTRNLFANYRDQSKYENSINLN